MFYQPKKLARSRKNIYILLSLLALIWGFAGAFSNFTVIIDYFGPADYVSIKNYYHNWGLFFLVTGISLFLLLLLLAIRAGRNNPMPK